MFKVTLKGLLIAGAAVVSVGLLPQVQAQEAAWPSKPIKFIVPFPAGGVSDVVSRDIANQLREALGQPVVVENVSGVGGGHALSVIASAPADGYTIGYAQTNNLAINPHLYAKAVLKYDPVKDFTPVATLVKSSLMLIVNASTPYNTLADLIAAGKAKPGTITYGSAGNGTGSHLATELLSSMTGAKYSHIPYKGFAAAETDLMAGHVNFLFTSQMAALSLAKSGKARVLATAGAKRSEREPGIPSVAETLPGYEVDSWSVIVAPAGLPKAITQRLTDEIAKILRKPDVVERLNKQGWDVIYGTPEQSAQLIRKDLARWGPIVKASGLKID